MKKIQLSIQQIFVFIIVGLMALSMTSCIYREEVEIISEREDFTLDLPAFSTVTLDFSAKVLIYRGDEQRIKINAQPEVFEAITKSVVDGEWLIDLANFTDGYQKVTIEITLPTLTGLHTTSNGDIQVKDDFKDIALLNLSTSSNGDIAFKGSAQRVDLQIDSNGDIELSGAADLLNVHLDGSGDLSAYDLRTQTVDLISKGSGDAEIRVAKALNVVMSGSGDVTYKGQPTITSDISGSGDLKKD
ncbi:MAG: head GIN domain-containing protein [Bacteroidota bacterium]